MKPSNNQILKLDDFFEEHFGVYEKKIYDLNKANDNGVCEYTGVLFGRRVVAIYAEKIGKFLIGLQNGVALETTDANKHFDKMLEDFKKILERWRSENTSSQSCDA